MADSKTGLLLRTFDFTFYLMDIVLEDGKYSHLCFHGVSNTGKFWCRYWSVVLQRKNLTLPVF